MPAVRDMVSMRNDYLVVDRNVVSVMSHDCSLSRCWVTICVSQAIGQDASSVDWELPPRDHGGSVSNCAGEMTAEDGVVAPLVCSSAPQEH